MTFFYLIKGVTSISQHQLQLATIILTQNTFKGILERAIRTTATREFAAAYRRWLEQNKKFVHIGDGYVDKS
jgi:hypothetical protein